jgi:hypothetical protein
MINSHISKEDGRVCISPSSIGTWFNDSAAWYKHQVLKQNSFHGNTSTYIGSICHWKANCLTTGKEFREDDVEAFLDEAKFNPEVDPSVVRSEYQEMNEQMTNYLSSYPLDTSEIYMEKILNDKVKVGGTADGFRQTSVVDFKTCKAFPYNGIKPDHFYQALMYAWLRKETTGQVIDKVEILYLKRPNSKSKASYSSYEREILESDWLYIENLIKNINEAVLLSIKDPKLVPILFRDNPTSFYGKD